eukprot:5866656-Pyramimonas_sp.AAC.1
MKAVFHLSCGPSCPLALEYRWKHMEKANAWCYRGQAQHNILFRAFKRAYDRKAVESADKELSDAAARGESAQSGSKQVVKAGL